MQKKITPERLNELALDASLKEYKAILKRLEKSARKGKNGISVTHISDIIIARLENEGYAVTSYFKVKYNFFLQSKMIKRYRIRFKT